MTPPVHSSSRFIASGPCNVSATEGSNGGDDLAVPGCMARDSDVVGALLVTAMIVFGGLWRLLVG
jgi:hypothetical protein